MHSQLIEKAAEDGIDTIITCDNGIAASAEIQQAKEKGMTVIVTDHHEIPYRDTDKGREWIVPEADAVINPKQSGCPYPNKNICGAVVAWKLIWALYETYGIDRNEILEFSEPAAVATVGDVMDLQGENRIIVKEGLRRLPTTKNQGFRALIEQTAWEVNGSQPIMWDLCWDHVSMQAEGWTLRPGLCGFFVQRMRTERRRRPGIWLH